jgi:hypothetical protein
LTEKKKDIECTKKTKDIDRSGLLIFSSMKALYFHVKALSNGAS